MNGLDFDSLILNNQGFNTMDSIVNSGVMRNMTQDTLHNIQAMQTQMPQAQLYQPGVNSACQPQNQQCPIAGMSQPNHQFFAIVNGAQKGPFTLEQIKGLAIADVIDTNTMVWMPGMPEWVDLKTCLSNLQM